MGIRCTISKESLGAAFQSHTFCALQAHHVMPVRSRIATFLSMDVGDEGDLMGSSHEKQPALDDDARGVNHHSPYGLITAELCNR